MAEDAAATDAAFLGRYRAAIGDVADDPVRFQSYFNRCQSEDGARIAGLWDFSAHILVPDVLERVSDPASMSVLEIGFGGGRLLAAACKFFGFAYGVDIHNNRAETNAFIEQTGSLNFSLLRSHDGVHIPLDSGSVDFVYSFLVLMHVRSESALKGILSEVRRVLRPGGLAHLYYAYSDDDNAAEEILTNKPNEITLKLGERRAHEAFARAGLNPVGAYRSYYRTVDGRYIRHGKQKSIIATRH